MARRIMIVDDDTIFLEELQETLVLNGYDVIAVTNAMEVVDQVKKTNPILILLDLKMPEKSGFQIATELHRLPETSRIPIIAMTGTYNDEAFGPLLRISGIRTCLSKPFQPQEVLKMIKVMLKYEIDK